MTNKVKALVTSAGTASSINVIKALKCQREYEIEIIAVDADRTAPGLYLADEYTVVPKCLDYSYVPRLIQLCKHYQIKVLYPIYSQEIEIIAENISYFKDVGVCVLLPNASVVSLCNDKLKMYELVTQLGISVPQAFTDSEVSFPLFAKPNKGSGSNNAIYVESQAELNYIKTKYPELLLQEFVKGSEYTIDGLCDCRSNLIVASPRLRLAIKSGQSIKGITVAHPQLIQYCEKICKAIGMIGPCNLQFIEKDGKFVFIEINPRYAAGGLMLTVHAGGNIPLLALKLMLGENVTNPTIQTGVTMLRYWEEIFLEEELST